MPDKASIRDTAEKQKQVIFGVKQNPDHILFQITDTGTSHGSQRGCQCFLSDRSIKDMLKANEKYISIEEYFAREDTAELRSEYYCGDVFAMVGGTPNHNRITVNLTSLLNSQSFRFFRPLQERSARRPNFLFPP